MYYLCSPSGNKLCWFATEDEATTAWNEYHSIENVKSDQTPELLKITHEPIEIQHD